MKTPIRLLFVEDSEGDVLLVIHELERQGFEPDYRIVDTADELQDALDESTWDAVISDYMLPEFDGLAAIEIVTSRDPDLPLIVVSGAIGEAVAVDAMRAGAHDYVMKDNLARLGPVVRRELEEVSIRRARRVAEEALRESEARYRAVVEDRTDFVIRWIPDGTRTFVNRAYCEYFEQPRERLIGANLFDHLLASDCAKIHQRIAGLTIDKPVATDEHRVKKPDGNIAWHEWVARGIFDDQGALIEIQSVGRDVTERHRAEDAERRERILVEVLRDTAAVLNSTLDLDGVFDRILANIGWVIPHDAAAIFFVEGSSARVIKLRGWEEFGLKEQPASVPLTDVEQEALSAMVRGAKSLVVSDTSVDERWQPGTRRLGWVRSFAAAPLFDESRALGVLALFSAVPGHFSPAHVELLEGFASHAATATKNARLFEAVSLGRNELKRLSSKIVDAQEDERRRISVELHDEVGQALAVLIMNADFVTQQFEKDCPPVAYERLQEIGSLARQILDQIRNLSYRLRPAMLDELGLAPTVRWLAERFSDRMGLELDLQVDLPSGQRFGSHLEITLYRGVQEALTNVAKHAEASAVFVCLRKEDSVLELCVEDDGKGFDSTRIPSPTGATGLGLAGMQERVSHLEGEFSIGLRPGGGTRLCIRIPIEQNGSQDSSEQ